MPQQAYRRPGTDPARTHGRFFAYGERFWTFPVASFVFAYNSIDLHALADQTHGLASRSVQDGGACRSFVDAVSVLDKGFVFWASEHATADSLAAQDGYLNSRPALDSATCPVAAEPGQVLTAMTSWLNDVLADAWMPRFNIGAYLGTAPMGASLGIKTPPGGR